jgi:hypothetical protein
VFRLQCTLKISLPRVFQAILLVFVGIYLGEKGHVSQHCKFSVFSAIVVKQLLRSVQSNPKEMWLPGRTLVQHCNFNVISPIVVKPLIKVVPKITQQF